MGEIIRVHPDVLAVMKAYDRRSGRVRKDVTYVAVGEKIPEYDPGIGTITEGPEEVVYQRGIVSKPHSCEHRKRISASLRRSRAIHRE